MSLRRSDNPGVLTGAGPARSGEPTASTVEITSDIEVLQRRILHLETELAHAARLNAVGEMFSELAHEINQPLGAAANYTRACVRLIESGENRTTAQLRDWMEKANAQAVRASEIVQRIGAYVKKGSPVRSSLDINEVIKHVVALPILDVWCSGAVHRVTPQLKLQRDLPGVMADRIQIEQVLLNVIRNAMDAMADASAADRRLVIGTVRERKFVKVSVKDSGAGMTPEQVARVFTPFFSTKPNGMGLGLSISKSIIEAHAGTLAVESRLGSGATFCFRLPITKAEERI